MWTAVTGCRGLNKVTFFKHSSDKHDEINHKCVIGYYERKIHYYREQDRKAKGTLPKEGYMNVKWFLDNYIYNVTYIMDVDFVPV